MAGVRPGSPIRPARRAGPPVEDGTQRDSTSAGDNVRLTAEQKRLAHQLASEPFRETSGGRGRRLL